MIIENNDVCIDSDKILPTPGNLDLPNLHFNYYQNKKKRYYKGVCLDFGFFSVVDDTNDFSVSQAVLQEELIFMANTHVKHVIKQNNFDLLFINRIPNQGGWEDFAHNDNEGHMMLLQKSAEVIKATLKLNQDQQEKENLKNVVQEIKGRVDAIQRQSSSQSKLDAILAVVVGYQYGKDKTRSITKIPER